MHLPTVLLNLVKAAPATLLNSSTNSELTQSRENIDRKNRQDRIEQQLTHTHFKNRAERNHDGLKTHPTERALPTKCSRKQAFTIPGALERSIRITCAAMCCNSDASSFFSPSPFLLALSLHRVFTHVRRAVTVFRMPQGEFGSCGIWRPNALHLWRSEMMNKQSLQGTAILSLPSWVAQ